MPNLCWEAAYFQMHIFANAYRDTGTDEIAQILPRVLQSEFSAPQARAHRPDQSSHLSVPARRPGQRQGQFTIVREATRPVHPDPYLVTHSLGDWTATLSSLEI